MKVLSPPTTKDKTKMKSTELRSGNLVNMGEYLYQPLNAYNIYQLSLLEKGGTVADFYHKIAPIELTEDWLKRFSIEKLHVSGYVIDGATYWKKGGIVFYEIKGKYYLPVGENITHGKTVIEFNKVHELQNIFALTGEELEIK